ncbi:hypothetical protein BH20ACI1_BH20ACI1_03540 [soil metagenome]
MQTHIQILRWIAVLPGAIIAVILSLIPLHLILYIIFTKFVEVYPETPERILAPALISGVFIWVGSQISPTYKFETAIVLFGIWMFLVGGFVFLTFSGGQFYESHLYFQNGGLPTLMAVIGAIIGLFVVRVEQTEQVEKVEANETSGDKSE